MSEASRPTPRRLAPGAPEPPGPTQRATDRAPAARPVPLRGPADQPVPHRRPGDRPAYRVAKRLLDCVAAAAALVVLSPLIGVVALLVRITSPGPALFRQTRVGRDGRPFTMLKFRTMTDGVSDELHRDYVRRLLTEEATAGAGSGSLFKLSDDPRLTPLGRWLRRTSLDELPQLVNVVLGEMSLVGPRPVLPWEKELLRERYAARFSVTPGITGLWQTSGRSTLTMRQALELDLEYVRRCGFLFDLRLLLRTAVVILRLGDAA